MKLPHQVLKQAFELGKSAFHTGKKAVPAHDAGVMKMIGKYGSATQLLDAWNKGWHGANIDAPVPTVYGRVVVAVPFIKRRVERLSPVSEEKTDEGIKWLSASRPQRKRFTGGGEKWVTKLTGTRNGNDFSVLRALVDARSPQPTEVVIDGKKLRWS